MTAALEVFRYADTEVRTVLTDGQPWFVLADVCRVLGLTNPSMAATSIDADGLSTTEVIDSMGRPQTARTVSESGLYELIFQSRRPEAKEFRRWVTADVLPQLRRTGSYGAPTLDLDNRDHVALIVQAGHAALTRAVEAEARVAVLEPQAQVATRLLDADGDLSVSDAAKALTRGGVKVGAGRLFTLLQGLGWTYRAGDNRWRVYQRVIEQGLMSVLPMSHYHPKTGLLVLDPPQPRVTPKGLAKLLAEYGPATELEPVSS